MGFLKWRCLLRFAPVSWEDLRRYYADFPWNDYCFRVRDRSLCAERITKINTKHRILRVAYRLSVVVVVVVV
ncbi:hypothetical protein E2C01_058792 [Portunus trituberculatus]|uniref:Uncharacterized protein n=1 Tax=Portunus trituberculatus TaxID=210409 RepID=A0A5B7H0S4_PORTR|nr:hypothetical protein [Portunus trituberculatus]